MDFHSKVMRVEGIGWWMKNGRRVDGMVHLLEINMLLGALFLIYLIGASTYQRSTFTLVRLVTWII